MVWLLASERLGRYSFDESRSKFGLHRHGGATGIEGQSLVEFALILPLMLLLVLGTLDFSRAYFTTHLINNASREGARVGIIAGTTSAQVIDVVNNQLNVSGLAGTAAINVAGVDGAAPGDLTSVQVAVNFQTMTGTFIPGWQGIIPLRQTTVMRHE